MRTTSALGRYAYPSSLTQPPTLRTTHARHPRRLPFARSLGAALVAFAWIYPEFLDASRPTLAYLHASPMGVLPCPTLALLIGSSLLLGSPGGRLASRVLALAGIFYGAWGTLRLGVWIDIALLLGAGLLLVATRRLKPRRVQHTDSIERARQPAYLRDL